jgi:hypothetical protein
MTKQINCDQIRFTKNGLHKQDASKLYWGYRRASESMMESHYFVRGSQPENAVRYLARAEFLASIAQQVRNEFSL